MHLRHPTLLVAALCWLSNSIMHADGQAFLATELPLKLEATTPAQLLTSTGSVLLQGSDPITAIFTRPVIALGSDFGNTDNNGDKVPFRMTCNIPGKFRWVTTYIARFDPDIDWPTDIQCQLDWNAELTTFDGVVFTLPPRASVPVRTKALTMALTTVKSELATNLTDNNWNAFTGLPDDYLPEVPPDGRIELTFSYPVNLKQLQSALQAGPEGERAGKIRKNQLLRFVVEPCDPEPDFIPLDVVLPSPSVPSLLPDYLDANSSCARVHILDPLDVATQYQLVLPKNSTYNALSGPLRSALNVTFGGLRLFRLPLLSSFQQEPKDGSIYSGVGHTKLNLWLVHGLDPSTSLSLLAAAINVCAEAPVSGICGSVPFQPSLYNNGTLQLTVPTLTPSTKYRVTVSPTAQVLDGFGLDLQASNNSWLTNTVSNLMMGPATLYPNSEYSSTLPAGSPINWPFLVRGSPTPPQEAGYWRLDVTDPVAVTRALRLISTYYDTTFPNPELGAPDGALSPPSGSDPKLLLLGMSGAPQNLYLTYTCCRQETYPFPRQTLSSLRIVGATNVSVSLITGGSGNIVAWVTAVTAAGANMPVANAQVTIYRNTYVNGGQQVNEVGSCTTTSTGTCEVPPPKLAQYESAQLAVLAVTPDNQATLVPNAASVSTPMPQTYTGLVILDRALVKQDDTLHVTGYVQQVSQGALQAPTLPGFTLTISPNFDPMKTALQLPVQLDPVYGSLHTNVTIPANASSGTYSIGIMAPSSSPYASPITSATFVVSDPRPPTAELLLTTPTWAPPNSAVLVSVKAVSYLGTDVGNANMTVGWTAGSNAQGLQWLVTDSSGAGSTTIDLSKLGKDNATKVGDSLSISVDWIGPTREKITKSAIVPLQDSPLSISLQFSPSESWSSPLLPGIPFFTQATVSSTDSGAVKGVPVTLSLVATNASCSADGLPTCTVISGAPFDFDGCHLSLPCMGTFAVRACTADGPAACFNTTVGRAAADWSVNPWYVQPSVSMYLVNTAPVAVGDTALLGFANPWENTMALIRWGNGLKYKESYLENPLPVGGVTLNLPLGPECEGGCGVVVLLAVGAGSYGSAPPNVTTSKLFNPQDPFTTSLSATINIAGQAPLNVTLDLGSATVLAPGQEALWTVTVTQDDAPAANAQVTIMAVDKAILDLSPYALQDPAGAIQVIMDLVQQATIRPTAVYQDAINAAFATALHRLGIDPWVTPLPYVTPNTASAIDMSDEEYFKNLYTTITVYPDPYYVWRGPSRGGAIPEMLPAFMPVPMPVAVPTPVPMAAPTPLPQMDASRNSGASPSNPSTSPSLRSQDNFVTTPLFTWFTTDLNGAGQVNFTAPQNLGSFVVRAYAASPSGRYGQAEDSVIVRRTVSLTASLPRFVRVGDTFEGGVIVTVVSPDSVAVTVLLTIGNAAGPTPLSLVAPSSAQTVTLGGAGAQPQAEVRFKFKADSLGEAKLTFTADDGQGAVDAVELDLVVEQQQGSVVVATSFALYDPSTTNSSAAWQEGLDLPEAVPGSGSLDLKMGVGYLPAVLSIADSLQKVVSDDPNGPLALARSTMPPVLTAYYVQPLSAVLNLTLMNEAAVDLSSLTLPQYGLQYRSPGASWTQYWCPIVLNSQAAYLAAAYPVQANNPISVDWVLVQTLSTQWKDALANQLVRDATQARTATPAAAYADLDTLAWALLALGPTWTPTLCGALPPGSGYPACASTEVAADLSISRLTSELDKQSLQTQLLTALALGASDPTVTSAVTTSILGNLRVQGQTAYLAASEGSQSPAPLLDQSLALLVLTQAAINNQLVPKLAAYVAAGQVATSFVTTKVYGDPVTQAFRAKALNAYDASTASTTPDLLVGAYVGNTTLTSTLFNSSSQLVLTSTKWEDLPSPPPPLEFTANGTGQVSVAASLNFVPATLLPYPTYRGVWVEAVVRQQDPLTTLPTGPSLQQVPLKSVVVVTVQVTTPDALGEAVLEVWLPGGLEALDPNVAPGVSQVCSLGDALGGYRPYGWWWPVCPAQDTRTDKVIFRWQYLAAGTSSVQFMAVAATPGNFVMPPITAYAAQQPEVMGMTAGYYFVICDSSVDPTCTPLAAAAQPPAKACPGDCNGNGVCDITVGTCNCDGGYSGDSCDTFSAYASS